ncbi:YfjI family protein [Vreelandella janggokensis]|uniref:YfjI family protein n=1 Tax=Vreelandella janggokensis TaxID=370767 RepID=UPI00285B4BD4|nr:YfjI family protein [Halomonas janggokensis]MDR5885004.1 YfjI family protein [Halomonas janggokensis]
MAITDTSPMPRAYPVVRKYLLDRFVEEVSQNQQVHRDMVQLTALAAISTAVQGLVVAKWPDGRSSSASLYTLIIAGSGEGKTPTYSEVFKGVLDFQKRERTVYENANKNYLAEHEVWVKKKEVILKKIARMTSKGEGTVELEEQFKKHLADEPVVKKEPIVLYENSTAEALIDGMLKSAKFATLVSSEGGSILKSSAFKNDSLMNGLWSNETVSIHRKTAGSGYLSGGRLTTCIMVQPDVFGSYLKNAGRAAKGSGMWARFLITEPERMVGKRSFSARKKSITYSVNFTNRIVELLELTKKRLENEEGEFSVSLSHGAQVRFMQVCNGIESDTAPGCLFHGFEDHAAKLPDNILRVACLMSVFINDPESEISEEVLEKSIDIVMYYSYQFRNKFYSPSESDIDDQEMMDWIEIRRANGQRYYRKAELQRYCPSRLRKIKRLDPCLIRLQQLGVVGCFVENGVNCIDLAPGYPFDPTSFNFSIIKNSKSKYTNF